MNQESRKAGTNSGVRGLEWCRGRGAKFHLFSGFLASEFFPAFLLS
jgi:hypothetical protein